jgi:hypothetical protein
LGSAGWAARPPGRLCHAWSDEQLICAPGDEHGAKPEGAQIDVYLKPSLAVVGTGTEFSSQTDAAKRFPQQPILVPSRHDHRCGKGTGRGERLSRQQVQATPSSVELTGHDGRDDPPREYLDLIWELEDRSERALTSIRR